MARLPDPVLREVALEPPGDLQNRLKTFYQMIGQAIKKATLEEKKGERKERD